METMNLGNCDLSMWVRQMVTNVPLWWGLMMVAAVHLGRQGVWEISVLASQFCCEPNTALKNKVYFFQECGG